MLNEKKRLFKNVDKGKEKEGKERKLTVFSLLSSWRTAYLFKILLSPALVSPLRGPVERSWLFCQEQLNTGLHKWLVSHRALSPLSPHSSPHWEALL